MSLETVADYEKVFKKKTPKAYYEYFRRGAANEVSLCLNTTAYNEIRINCLRNVSQRNQSVNILGNILKMPIGIAPTAMQKLAHSEGEVASAKAAGKCETIFILSSFSTTSIEEVGAKVPETIKFLQLYIYKNRNLTRSFVKRAESYGFKAIVVTIDSPITGITDYVKQNVYPLPNGYKLENFIDPEISVDLDASLTWSDIQWIVSITSLPIIVKGILRKEDAISAVKAGCKGIIVSNHGARLLDGVPATIEVLSEVAKAVSGQIEIMIDGGIRTGTDVFRALSLGASMVFIGRPVIYGLSVNGTNGVENILNILSNELDSTMALSGCSNVNNIDPDIVVHKTFYSKL